MITIAMLDERVKKDSIRLLGQIEISDDEFQELKQYTRVKIHNPNLSSLYIDIKLSIFMVQVAIREYKEGRYWPCFSEIIGESIPPSKQNYLGQVFLKTIQHYKLFSLEKRENGSQVFVENIKAHAFVTNWYMEGYFEFSQAYYENNLFRQIDDEDIENDFADLSSFMQTTLGGNSDTISEKGSATHAARSYRLLKSTRAVISQADPDLLKEVFYPTLRLIDRAFYDDAYPQGKDRFEAGFIRWQQKRRREQEETPGKLDSPGYRRIYSQKPYIAVNRRDMTFELVIPKQKFRNEECKGTASIVVICGESRIEQQMELYKSFGIYISEEIRIPISNIFGSVKISIVSESRKEHEINASIYRLFNSSWGQIKKFEIGRIHLLVQKGNSVKFNDESQIIDAYEEERWYHYDVMVTKDTVCFLNSLMLSVIGEFSQEPLFEDEITKFDILSPTGSKLLATHSHPVVSFFVSQDKMMGTALEVNDKKYPIRSFSCFSAAKWPQDEKMFAVTMRLDESEITQDDGLYLIRVNVPGESPKVLAKYLLLHGFNCRVTDNIYVYADFGTITISPDGHSLEIDSLWESRDFPDGTIKCRFPLENDTDHVDFGLVINDERYIVRNRVKVFAYGFSKENLTVMKADYLWYKDLRESLYLRLPGAADVSVHLSSDKQNKVLAEHLGDGLFRVDIASFMYAINSEQLKRKFYLNIDYKTYRKKWVSLPVIYRKPDILPYFFLDYSVEDGISTNVSIVGNAEVFLTVRTHNKSDVVIDRQLIVKGKNNLKELTPDGYYDFEPVMVESDGFFATSEEPLHIIHGIGIVPGDDFTNCRLPITSLIYQETELELGPYSYFLNIQGKYRKNVYYGLMKCWQSDKQVQICGKALITVYNSTQEMTVSVMLQSHDNSWAAPYYDKGSKRILSSDSEIVMKSRDYKRFLLLDEDEAEYAIDIDKIRRYR